MPFDSTLARAFYDLDDEPAGTWPYERLVQMNTDFAAALEQAFELGLESRESTRREVKVPATRTVRLSTPLPLEIGLLRSAASWL